MCDSHRTNGPGFCRDKYLCPLHCVAGGKGRRSTLDLRTLFVGAIPQNGAVNHAAPYAYKRSGWLFFWGIF